MTTSGSNICKTVAFGGGAILSLNNLGKLCPMSDIFISYSSEDRAWVSPLAAALSGQGWDVWWDRSMVTGRSFDEVIETELAVAKAVVVVWPRNSIDSRWVRAEAQEGLDHKKLIPVLLEKVKPPLIFRSIHATKLVGWNGSRTSVEFRKLVGDIELLIGLPSANSEGGAKDYRELPAGNMASPNGPQQRDTVSTITTRESTSTAQLPSLSGSRSRLGLAKWIVATASILFVIGMMVISFRTEVTSSPVEDADQRNGQVDSCDHPNPPIACLFR